MGNVYCLNLDYKNTKRSLVYYILGARYTEFGNAEIGSKKDEKTEGTELIEKSWRKN